MNKEKYILVPDFPDYFKIIYKVDIRALYTNILNSMYSLNYSAITPLIALISDSSKAQGVGRPYTFDDLIETIPHFNKNTKYKSDHNSIYYLGGRVGLSNILSHNNDCFISTKSSVDDGKVIDHAMVINSNCSGYNIIKDNAIIILTHISNSGAVYLCDNTYILNSFFNIDNRDSYFKISGYTTIFDIQFITSAKVCLHNCIFVCDVSASDEYFIVRFRLRKNQNLNGLYFNFNNETKNEYISFFKKYDMYASSCSYTNKENVIEIEESGDKYTILLSDFIKYF